MRPRTIAQLALLAIGLIVWGYGARADDNRLRWIGIGCFGAAFLSVHPVVYAHLLGDKMVAHETRDYLVNTGWIGGAYGVGRRMDLPQTRRIIDAILDGSIENSEFEKLPIFNFDVPTALHDVDTALLNPRNCWADKDAYDAQARRLGQMFIDNFRKFANNDEGRALEHAGPQL